MEGERESSGKDSEVKNGTTELHGLEYLKKAFDPEDTKFWIDRRTTKIGNFFGLLALCPEREVPRLFFQKMNKQSEESSRFSISLRDARALCDQVEYLLADIDSVAYEELPTSLRMYPGYASLDPRDNNFWDKKVAWTTFSEEVRCRILVKANGEKYIIVNSPREIPDLRNWNGYMLW